MEFPIIQAPIGSATTPALASAVSNCGGLGTLALSWRAPSDVRTVIRETFTQTRRRFAANFVLEWPQEERVRIALEEGVPIISTFWGDPTVIISMAKEAGALCIHTVGSAQEVPQAIRAGVDVLVAQGYEAGGHVRATQPLRESLADVLQLAGSVP